MLDMKTDGISVRPIEQMHGARGFNETFFEEVRVPDKNMIGDENRGWYAATTTLDFERSGAHRAAAVQRAFTRNLDFLTTNKEYSTKGNNRILMAETATELEIGRLFGYRVGWMQSKGLVPNYEASMSKVYNSELTQRQARRFINMLGLYGNLSNHSDYSALNGLATREYMSTVSSTIAAGTSEIQRNIIATRGLGLPRG